MKVIANVDLHAEGHKTIKAGVEFDTKEKGISDANAKVLKVKNKIQEVGETNVTK